MASSWPSVPPTPPTSRLTCMSGSLPQCLRDRSAGGFDELRALNIRNNPPSIVFDNVSDERSTLVKVGSASRHGCLLEVVQLLSDLNLVIPKAFISSDAAWFVDVFHVRDSAGEKLRDRRLMAYIQQALGAPSFEEVAPPLSSSSSRAAHPPAAHLPAPPHHAHSAYAAPTRSISANQTLSTAPFLESGNLSSSAVSSASASVAAAAAAAGAASPAAPGGAAPPASCCLAPAAHTTIEITGGDRPGILANVAAVLAAAQCNVVGAEVWTHNGRVACVVCVTDNTAGGGRIKDPLRLKRIRAELAAIVRPVAAAAASPSAACHAPGIAASSPEVPLLPPDAPSLCPPPPASASPTSSLSPGLSPPPRPPRAPTSFPPHAHTLAHAHAHAQTIPAVPPNLIAPAAADASSVVGAGVAVQGSDCAASGETGRSMGEGAVAARAEAQAVQRAAEKQHAFQAAMLRGQAGAQAAPPAAAAAGGGVWTDVEWDSVAWRGDMRERGRGERGGGAVESTSLPVTMAHAERRLHQLLFADRDYEDNTVPAPVPAAAAPTASADAAPAPTAPAALPRVAGMASDGGASGGSLGRSETGRQGGVECTAGLQRVQLTRPALMPLHSPRPSPHVFAQPALSSPPLYPPAAAAAAVAAAAAAAVASGPYSLSPTGAAAAAVPALPPHPSRPTPGLTVTAPMGWAASGLFSQVVSTEPGGEERASGVGRQGCAGATGGGSSGGAWMGGRLMGSRAPATGGVVGRRSRRGGPSAGTSSTAPGLCSNAIGSSSGGSGSGSGGGSGVRVSVRNSVERQYSVVRVRCRDRPKLLFDTVCTLTDMGYMVHHGAISSHHGWGLQEYYIRQMDGSTLESEAERQRVIKCVEAAIERRTPKGVHLELCVNDRAGLLCDVTRLLLSHNLSVAAANVSTRGSTAVDEFIVTDSSGRPVDVPKVLAAVRQHMGPQAQVTVKGVTEGDEGEDATAEAVGSGKGARAVGAGGAGGVGGRHHVPGMHRSHSCGWQPGWGSRGAACGTGPGSSSGLGLSDRQLGAGTEGEEFGEDEFGLGYEDEDEEWGQGTEMFGGGLGSEEGEGGEEAGESSSILGAVWRQSEWLLSSLGFGTKSQQN